MKIMSFKEKWNYEVFKDMYGDEYNHPNENQTCKHKCCIFSLINWC